MKILTMCLLLITSLAITSPAQAEWWVKVLAKDKSANALYVDMDSWDNYSDANTDSVIAKYDGLKLRFKIYVELPPCLAKGMGHIAESNLDGSNPDSKLWQYGGDTTYDHIGEFMCGTARLLQGYNKLNSNVP